MSLGSFLLKFFEDSFLTFNPEIESLVFADAVICMIWSIILSIVIAVMYRETHRGISYSQNFTQTLVLLSVIVSAVMLIVGTDIARAFTLVGALSIVRFRNAIKETRDVGFIFFTMAIGMACGTRFYALGMVVTFTGCLITYLMFRVSFGQKGVLQDIIEFNVPKTLDYSSLLGPLFAKNLKYYSVLSVDGINETENRLSFVVTFKKKFHVFSVNKNGFDEDSMNYKANLVRQLEKMSKISNIKVISGANAVEI